MIYLSGHYRPEMEGLHPQLGVMLTPMQGYTPGILEGGLLWAADTGCFSQPEAFTLDRYLAWLSYRQRYRARCLFITAPDRFNDGPGTLAAALPVIPQLARAGWPVAFVAQPGTEDHVPWGQISALFIGGPDWWHQSQTVADLVKEANGRGLWSHRGRVNTYGRIVGTAGLGFNSADGTTLARGYDVNIRLVLRALGTLEKQPGLL